MSSASPSFKAALLCSLLLSPLTLFAVPTAVNDIYTGTEDTVLSVTGTGTSNLLTADFEPGANQADGFTLVKNAFGTTAATTTAAWMSGALVTTDKHTGTSSYYVDCGRDNTQFVPKSVGIQTTITLASPATVRLTYWYRMKVSAMEWGGGGQYELGDHMLKVDSTLFGTLYTETAPNPDFSNTAVRHVLGPQGASTGSNAVNDSTWLQYTQDIALTAGSHTITLGAYNNSTNNNNEHAEIWFDDITIDTVNAAAGLLLNDTGGATSAVKVTDPTNGTLVFNANGTFTYTPSANFFGSDSFTYQASDGTDLSNIATVTLNITGVNDTPVAVANTYNLNEDVPLTVNAANGVLANDTDADGDTLTATVRTTTTNGTLTMNANGSFTYTPNANYSGTDSFTYRANDGTVNSNTVTVTLNIAAVNDAPVGLGDAYTMPRNTTFTISDPNGSSVVEDVILGAVRDANHMVTTPGSVWKYWDQGALPVATASTWNTALNLDETGWGSGASELGYGDTADVPPWPEATAIGFGPNAGSKYITAYFRKVVNLTDVTHITAVDLQLMRDDGVNLYINGQIAYWNNTSSSSPLFGDVATTNGSTEEHSWISASTLGSGVAQNQTPTAPSPALFVEGNNLVAAEVHQNQGTSSDLSFDVRLNVTRLTNFGLLSNDSDIEGNTFTAQLATAPGHGSATVNANGTFSYTPTIGYSGTDTFTYRAVDSLGAASAPITVTITITAGANVPPITVADSYNAVEDTTLTVAGPGVLQNDIDPDGDSFTAALLTDPTKGTLTLNPNGSFDYVPNLNATGVDTFTYRANDGGNSQPATVTITIAPRNDAPVANVDSYGGDPGATLTVPAATGVLANDTDVDGDTLTAILVTPPSSGSLVLNANGSFSYTPTVTGTYTFTYIANDGSTSPPGAANSNVTTVTIVLNGAPITLPESYPTNEDTPVTIPAATGVLNNDYDPESQPLTAQLVAQGSKGTVALNSNGSYTYTPNPNANGPDTFTYRAYDGIRLSTVTSVTINIAALNDPPSATANVYAVPQNSTLTVPTLNGVLSNDSDIDGQTITAVLDTNVLHGTLNLGSDGSFTYIPTLNFSGPDAFYYHATDGVLNSEVVKVTLNVSNAADDIVFNEIMCRPGTAYPENTDLEWIELYNRSSSTLDLSGWTISSGVSFTFPSGTIMASGSYLVVAANAASFHAAFPSVTNYVGGWTGTLSDTSEKLTLTDPVNVDHDSVTYASAGDWSVRFRETTFNGWDWDSKTTGGGYTIELRNPLLSNNNGQNWLASAVVNGTPGQPNAALSTNIPPIIKKVAHTPAVPTSSDQVVISCELDDETPFATLKATLYWRNATTTTPPAFSTVLMSQDGQGKWFAPLPKQANNAIIEFYVSATDGTLTRTWPAPTTEGQNANCQYQVSDEAVSTSADMYRMIMTAAENAAYEANAAVNSSSNKVDTNFNQTLVITHGTEATIRYRCSVRVRGNSSRSYQFKPLRIGIPSDDPLEGHTAFNLNPKASFLQYLGMRAFQAAGVRSTDAIPIELRRNGVEYTTNSGSTPDYGRWVRLEDLSGDMVATHWPEASTGGLYKKGRPDRYWRNTLAAPANPDTGYEQTGSGNSINPGWSKQNNSGQNDWSDLLGFFSVVQASALPHFPGTVTSTDVAASGGSATSGNGLWNSTAYTTAEITSLETVADLDEWARWMAVMTILQDKETNISNGEDDDYSMYFMPQMIGGVLRKRMQIVTHDMDTIFGLGDSPQAFNATNLYDATENGSVFRPLLPLLGTSTVVGNVDFRNRYHTALRQLFGGIFSADTTSSAYPPFYAWIDNHLTGWAPPATITAMKTFATQRQAYLLGTGAGLIGATPIAPTTGTSIAAFTATHGNLCIHEVLANNISAVNNSGTFPDVIELRNTGSTSISLAGMTLTDDPLLKTKYTFPAGTTIAAGAFLTLYADLTTTVAPGTHLGFSLDPDGDGVFLYNSLANGQTLVDSIVFGLQAPNLSIGRTGGGLDVWALCTPTPNAANTAVATLAAPSGLKINEWLSNAGTRFPDDFIELYNASANPVALGGMALTDDFINYPGNGVLPPLSFMAGSSFQSFLAKGSAATPSNARELPYTLSSSVGTVALLGANGALVDRVEIIAQFPDGSVGRTVDGGDNWDRLVTASPGASNAALPANTQNLLKYLRITELMYSPQTIAQSEYIELRNVSDLAGSPVTLDLGGVYFSNGIAFTFPTSTLAAGAHIVLAGEPAKFTAQFPAVPVGGTFLGKLDSNGERVTLMLPNYNIAILDFKYNNTWHPTTDGQGAALAIVDPLGTPDKWDLAIGWEPTPTSPGASPSFSVYAGPDTSVPVNTPIYLDGSIIKGSLAANSITCSWTFISGPSMPVFTTANYQDANATFSTPGVYVLRFSATGGTSTLTDDITIAVTETYAAWAARTLTGGNASKQGVQDDPDHDNVPNLIEWASGTNPAVADFPITVVPSSISGNFTIRYTRSKLVDPSVLVIPQFSAELTNWFDPLTGTAVETHQESESGTLETWTATSYLISPERQFSRLEVIAP